MFIGQLFFPSPIYSWLSGCYRSLPCITLSKHTTNQTPYQHFCLLMLSILPDPLVVKTVWLLISNNTINISAINHYDRSILKVCDYSMFYTQFCFNSQYEYFESFLFHSMNLWFTMFYHMCNFVSYHHQKHWSMIYNAFYK